MKFLFFFLALHSSLFAFIDIPEETALTEALPDLYTLAADTYLSPECGATNILSFYRGFYSFDTPWIKENLAPIGTLLGVGLRFLDLYFIDLPIAEGAMVLQHEVFGHGAYLRKEWIGAKYEIGIPYPYGSGGGATWFSSRSFHNLPHYKQSLIVTGGVEASYRLSTDLALYRLRRGSFPVQEALLHFLTAHDLTEYALGVNNETVVNNEGHDIVDYIEGLNSYYGKKVLSAGSLKGKILFNLIDPILWNDFSAMGSYIWNGVLETYPFCIKLGCFSIVPTARVFLAPYGLEYGTATYIGFDSIWSLITVRWGSTEGHGSFSVGIDSPYLFRDGPWIYGGKCDVWLQPEFRKDPEKVPSSWGGRLGLSIGYLFEAPFLCYAELSYKTRGYIPSEVGQSNINLLLGITYLTW